MIRQTFLRYPESTPLLRYIKEERRDILFITRYSSKVDILDLLVKPILFASKAYFFYSV